MTPSYKVETRDGYVYFGVFSTMSAPELEIASQQSLLEQEKHALTKMLIDIQATYQNLSAGSRVEALKYVGILGRFEKVAFVVQDADMEGYCNSTVEFMKFKNLFTPGKHDYRTFWKSDEATAWLMEPNTETSTEENLQD